MKDYFLFPHVGRMDDIWAAYYVQAKGYQRRVRQGLGLPGAQRARSGPRHEQEYLGYENNLASSSRTWPKNPESLLAYLPGRAAWAFELYRRHFNHA